MRYLNLCNGLESNSAKDTEKASVANERPKCMSSKDVFLLNAIKVLAEEGKSSRTPGAMYAAS